MEKNRCRFAVLAACGILLLASSWPVAGQLQVETKVAPLPTEVPLEMRDGVVELSLDGALEIALRRNLDMVIEIYNRTQARVGVEQTLGVYDPLTMVDLRASSVSRPPVSVTNPTNASNQQLGLGLSQFVPTGGLFSVGLQNSRSKSDISGQFNFLNPQYSSGLNLSFTQPLLRDFGRQTFERQIRLAQNRNEKSSADFVQRVVVTVQSLINGYWNLVDAREQLKVQQQSQALARELRERTRILIEAGTMAPLDLVQIDANIAANEEEIIKAEILVAGSEDALRRLMNLPQGPLWDAEIRLTTSPELEPVPPVDVREAIRVALENLPTIRAQRLAVEQARISALFFHNQVLPALDLTLTYGLAGNNAITVFNDQGTPRIATGTFGDALSQIFGADFDGWSAQLTFGYPLGNRGARSARVIADLNLENAKTALTQAEQLVFTDVRETARQITGSAKQIEAARASVYLQERSLEAERKRYENGRSSSFEINRLQQDLAAAKSRQITAIITHRRAHLHFLQSTGMLLKAYNIVIDDPEVSVDRWSFSLFRGRPWAD